MVARRLRGVAAIFLLAAGCSRTPTQPFHAGTTITSRWFPSNGPSNTEIWDLGSNGSALVASNSSGLLRTTDLGANWTAVSGAPVLHFARSGTDLFGFGRGPGFWMSGDGGATWSDRSRGLPAATVYAVAADSGWLWAGVESGGVYRSGDGGANWNPFNRGLPDGVTPAAFLVKGSELLLGTNDGRFFHSSDLGFTWTASGTLPSPVFVSALIAVGSEIVAASSRAGIFVSPDGGATWQAELSTFGIQRLAAQGTRVFAPGIQGVWISERSVKSWNLAAIPVPDGIGFVALESVSGSVFLGTTEIGVMRCDGLAAWTATGPPGEPALVGPPNATIGAIAEFGPGRLFAGPIGLGIFHTENVGATWASSGGETYITHAFASIGTYRFAASQAGLERSDDDGATWTNVGSFAGEYASVPVTVLGSNDRSLVAVKPGVGPWVFHSRDLGRTWSPGTGLPPDPDVRAVTAHDTHFLMAVKSGGATTIERSLDDGASWEPAGSVGLPAVPVRSLATSGLLIYAGGDAGVYVSRDDGERWTPTGLQSERVMTITARDRRVAAITASGALWWSTDGGATWALANQGLEGVTPLSVAFASDRWYVGTLHGGVWWHVY